MFLALPRGFFEVTGIPIRCATCCSRFTPTRESEKRKCNLCETSGRHPSVRFAPSSAFPVIHLNHQLCEFIFAHTQTSDVHDLDSDYIIQTNEPEQGLLGWESNRWTYERLDNVRDALSALT